VFESILEFELVLVTAMNGIRGGRNNLAFRTYSLPKLPVIKLATIGLASGVINVLYIDKNGNFFHKKAVGVMSYPGTRLTRLRTAASPG